MLPQVSLPQLPTPHSRVDPGMQAPWFAQTPLQPQVVPAAPQLSVPQRPQARVMPGMHWPSPVQAPHAQVAPQVAWPQLPQAMESPGLQVPSLRQVASQWQLGSHTCRPQLPQVRFDPARQVPSLLHAPHEQSLVQVFIPHLPQASESPGLQTPGQGPSPPPTSTTTRSTGASVPGMLLSLGGPPSLPVSSPGGPSSSGPPPSSEGSASGPGPGTSTGASLLPPSGRSIAGCTVMNEQPGASVVCICSSSSSPSARMARARMAILTPARYVFLKRTSTVPPLVPGIRSSVPVRVSCGVSRTSTVMSTASPFCAALTKRRSSSAVPVLHVFVFLQPAVPASNAAPSRTAATDRGESDWRGQFNLGMATLSAGPRFPASGWDPWR